MFFVIPEKITTGIWGVIEVLTNQAIVDCRSDWKFSAQIVELTYQLIVCPQFDVVRHDAIPDPDIVPNFCSGIATKQAKYSEALLSG
jgi:hypothetical protein